MKILVGVDKMLATRLGGGRCDGASSSRLWLVQRLHGRWLRARSIKARAFPKSVCCGQERYRLVRRAWNRFGKHFGSLVTLKTAILQSSFVTPTQDFDSFPNLLRN